MISTPNLKRYFNVAEYDFKFKVKKDFNIAEYDSNKNRFKDTEFEIENYRIKEEIKFMFKSSETDYKAQRNCQIEFKGTEYEGAYFNEITKECIKKFDYNEMQNRFERREP